MFMTNRIMLDDYDSEVENVSGCGYLMVAFVDGYFSVPARLKSQVTVIDLP